ncbi:MAG TPA: hypothetical protein VFL86_12670 [Burkholderiaceae bacterium]|nr:hypothetical protein [Burkholderiaceae bacterium]
MLNKTNQSSRRAWLTTAAAAFAAAMAAPAFGKRSAGPTPGVRPNASQAPKPRPKPKKPKHR